MRIREKYERDGYFWLPENPDHKIPGTLKVSDGGRTELNLMGLLDEDRTISLNKMFGQENNNIDRIVGQVEKDGPVTLENCIYIPQHINMSPESISRSLVHVSKVFCGVRYEQNKLVKFNSVKFSVEGLDEWLGISDINVDLSNDHKTTTITYKSQKKMVYELMDGFKLHIGFSYTLPSFSHTVEAKVTQKAYIELSSIKERDFQDFIKIIHEITYLLCFAIDATVTISDVVATSDSCLLEVREGEKYPVPVHIYYGSLPFSPNHPNIDTTTMMFRFSDIKDDVRLFEKWLDVYLNIQPSINLYVDAVSNRHLKDRFLDLAPALETYHRGICPKSKEVSLSQRIGKLIEPYEDKFGSSDKRESLINNIVKTRNYFTHYNKRLKEKAVAGKDLHYICLKMEAIFQLNLLQNFLQRLGFCKPKIEKILQNNYKFQQKIKVQ